MKRLVLTSSLLLSMSAFSAAPQLQNLSKSDVENVTTEFGANFAHTAVAAPETDGVWGVEVGVVGTSTRSPDFSDVIDQSGGKGSDFKNIYNGGLMVRAHFPYDIFAEVAVLPEQKISDVKAKSQSFGVGWNLGGFMSWPVDFAIGFDHGKGDVSFHQTGGGGIATADIDLTTKTNVFWAGVSKTFWFFTPYLKLGVSRISGDLKAQTNIPILTYKSSQKEDVETSGGYGALGANFQFWFLKLGVEASQIQSVRKASAKISFDF